MTHYLDTSAVRQFGGKLAELAQKYKFETSMLTIVELLSKSDEKASYPRCKSQIESLLKSKIPISEDMPDKLILTGFDYASMFDFQESRTPCLKKIINFLINSEDVESFIKLDSESGSSHPLEYWKIFDNTFSKQFDSTFKDDTKMLKMAFQKSKEQGGSKEIPLEVLEKGFQYFCEWFMDNRADINFAATVNGLAVRAANDLPGEHSVEVIYTSYNGKNSAYVDATSRYAMLIHKNGGSPGRNDGLDLAHFLYIKEGYALITNDTKMLQLSEKIGCPVKRPEEFL